jgi:hypothetical protein
MSIILTSVLVVKISIVDGCSLSAGNLIPRRRANNYSLMLQWFSPKEIRCRQYQTIMTSRDMQNHIRDMSVTNDWDIGAQFTEWTYTNQPLYRPQLLVWCECNLRFKCPEWCGILSIQYMAKRFSCRILYIWLQLGVVKLRVLSFATIIKQLHTRWVYKRALSLAFGDTNLFVDNCLRISSFSYKVLPIAIVSHSELNTLMT